MASRKAWAAAGVVAFLVGMPIGSLAGAQESGTTTATAPTSPPPPTTATPESCEALARDLRAAHEAKVEDMRSRARAFDAERAKEREAFGQSPHTPEEWRAFGARHAEMAKKFYSEMWNEYTAHVGQMWDAYRARCGGHEPKAFAGWSMPEPPVPREYRSYDGPVMGTKPQPAQPSEPQPVTGQPPEPAHPEPAHPAEPAGDPACADLERELRARMAGHQQALAEEKRAFLEQQGRDREAFFAEKRSEDEARRFMEAQARALYERQSAWAERMEGEQRDLRRTWEERCGKAHGEAAAPAASPRPACAGDVGTWERHRMAFEHGMRAKREAFESQWRARWDEMQRGQPTSDDMASFKQQAAEARIAFEEEMRQAFEAWSKDHPAPEPCGPVVVVDRFCDPERMRLEVQEFERHLRERFHGVRDDARALQERMEAKRAAFEKEREHSRAAFMAEPRGEDERAAFEAREKAAWDEFHQTMEAEARALRERMAAEGSAFEQRMRAEMERFLKMQAERCFRGHGSDRPDQPVMGQPAQPAAPEPARPRETPKQAQFRTVADDIEAHRMRCMLEVRIQMQEFEGRQLRELRDHMDRRSDHADVASFESAQLEARKLFEARLLETRAACEKLLRERHDKAWDEAHRDAPPRDRMGSFRVEESEDTVTVKGAYVAFQGDKATEAIYGYTVGGQLFLDAIRKDARFHAFDVSQERGSSVMTLRGEGFKYRFHDSPTGLAAFRVEGGSVELDVADYLQVKVTPRGVELTGGDRRAVIAGDDLQVDGDRVVVRGAAEMFLPDERQEVLSKVANRHRVDIAKAVAEKRVAAEVTLVQGADGVASDRLTYGDMAVVVEKPRADGTVSVRIDNPGHEGKTVVLNVDKGLLAFLQGVKVRVFEVEASGERDARAGKASSLADVLDPGDDDGPEYWVVTDEDGVQVMVSFPHFSEKRVELQSTGATGQGGSDAGRAPRAVPGLEGLGVLAALGAAVLVARRRA